MLFKIDPRPYKAAYDMAQAALARDKATVVNAEKEAARYDTLVKKDYVTQEQADQQKANAAVAEATVQGDQANLETAKFNLDNTTIVAPISGRTGTAAAVHEETSFTPPGRTHCRHQSDAAHAGAFPDRCPIPRAHPAVLQRPWGAFRSPRFQAAAPPSATIDTSAGARPA